MPTPSAFEDAVRRGARLRRHEREYFASTVQLLTPGRRIVEARTLDISLGGLKLVLAANLAVGSRCGLRLVIPVVPFGARAIVAEAEVASIVFSGRENGFLAGLRFTTLTQEPRAALQAYLRERCAHRAYRVRARQLADSAGSAVPLALPFAQDSAGQPS